MHRLYLAYITSWSQALCFASTGRTVLFDKYLCLAAVLLTSMQFCNQSFALLMQATLPTFPAPLDKHLTLLFNGCLNTDATKRWSAAQARIKLSVIVQEQKWDNLIFDKA